YISLGILQDGCLKITYDIKFIQLYKTRIYIIKVGNNRYLGTAFASSDSRIAQYEGHRLTLEGIMRLLGVMMAIGCAPVDGVVRSGHAGALNNFFGLSNLGQILTFNE